MKNEWQNFLAANNATIHQGIVRHFGKIAEELKAAHQGKIIAPLNGLLNIIEVSGLDAEKFLQGQLTCDVGQLKFGQSSLGACCDHKGRMVATFWLLRLADSYLMILPEPMANLLLAQLNKYAVFSKVELSKTQKSWVLLGIYDWPISPQLQSQTSYIIPLQIHRHSSLIICELEYAKKIWQQAVGEVAPCGIEAWKLRNIQAGFTHLYPQTSGLFTPQMINLEKFHGVSFTKGCYIGQEVVARTQHLGKLKRHLHAASVICNDPPHIGDELFDGHNQSLGIICQVAQQSEDSYALLAVIQDRALESTIGLQLKNQVPVQIDKLS